MATNFPGSQDSFTNPTSSDTLDSPDHAAQHTNVNDAVEAIELALLDGAPLKIDDTNERVGIGTTSPIGMLHVSGSDPKIWLTDTDTNADSYVSGSSSVGSLILSADENNEVGSSQMSFKVDGTERITVLSSGNVGIGTTSPAEKLEVSDSVATVRLSSSATVPTANTELQAIDFYQSDASGGAGVSARIVGSANNSSGAQNIEFHTGQAGASSVAERMRIDSSGNVGVGTTAPDNKLHVQLAGTSKAPASVPTTHMLIADAGDNNDAGVAVYSANTGKGYMRFGDSDASARAGFSYDHATDELDIRTAGSDRVTIDSSGRMTMPYQPSFYAYQAGTGQSTGGTQPSQISFNNVQHNIGSHFSTSTDRFTAPIDGRYFVQWYGLGSATTSVSRYYLYINGAEWNNLHIRGDGKYPGYTRVVILDLNANDYLTVHYTNDSSAAQYTGGGNSYYTFSATLLG